MALASQIAGSRTPATTKPVRDDYLGTAAAVLIDEIANNLRVRRQ
jgi:hypothetical protein